LHIIQLSLGINLILTSNKVFFVIINQKRFVPFYIFYKHTKYHVSGLVCRLESIKKREMISVYTLHILNGNHDTQLTDELGQRNEWGGESLRNQFSTRCSVKSTKMHERKIQVF